MRYDGKKRARRHARACVCNGKIHKRGNGHAFGDPRKRREIARLREQLERLLDPEVTV